MNVDSFDEFQYKSRETAMYPGQGSFMGLAYATLGLGGEAGEVLENVKKTWRDDGEVTPSRKEAIVKELGDTLWYLSAVADEIGVELSYVAQVNLDKLSDRRERGVIGGSGDDR